MPFLQSLTFEEVSVRAAGVAGALVSVNFLQGPLSARLLMATGGAVLSFYGTHWAAAATGLPEGFTGFLLGLFGMAVVSRAWAFIQDLPLAAVWQVLIDWLRRITGTKPEK